MYCTHVYMYGCMYVCVYVCVYACMYVCMYTERTIYQLDIKIPTVSFNSYVRLVSAQSLVDRMIPVSSLARSNARARAPLFRIACHG